MYAIVDIAGQQFKVEKNQKIYVHHLEGESGTKIDLDKVMLIDNNQTVIVGSPVIEGAMVYASILDHLKSDKVLVFKKKRKKGYRKLFGHRQYLTQILIEDIIEKGAKARIVAEKAKPFIAADKEVTDKESTLPSGPDVSDKATAASPVKKKTTPKPVKEAKAKSDAEADKKVEKTVEKKSATKKPAAPGKTVTAKKPAAKKTGGKTSK